jgi:hypothetical protein
VTFAQRCFSLLPGKCFLGIVSVGTTTPEYSAALLSCKSNVSSIHT